MWLVLYDFVCLLSRCVQIPLGQAENITEIIFNIKYCVILMESDLLSLDGTYIFTQAVSEDGMISLGLSGCLYTLHENAERNNKRMFVVFKIPCQDHFHLE